MILYRRLLVSVPNVLWEPVDTAYVAFPHKIYLAVRLYRLHARTNGTLLTILKNMCFSQPHQIQRFFLLLKIFQLLIFARIKVWTSLLHI